MPQAGYLVCSEVYYPGWHAQVDGRTSRIYRANYAFRAVYLDPGTHHVVLTFRPFTWYLGIIVTALVCLILLVWASSPGGDVGKAARSADPELPAAPI